MAFTFLILGGGATASAAAAGRRPTYDAAAALAFANEVNGRRVVHLSYGTQWVQSHCLSLFTALAHGVKPIVLGSRRQLAYNDLGPLDKLFALNEATRGLATLPVAAAAAADPLIVFNDGYDVAFMGGAAAVLERFERVGRPLVFAGERGCCTSFYWMRRLRNDCIKRHQFPEPSGKLAARDPRTRWVNSGLIAGTQRAFRTFLTAAIAKRKRHTRDWGPPDTYKRGTDQLIVCDMLSDEAMYGNSSAVRRAIIDYGSEIFQCMYQLGLNQEAPASRSSKDGVLVARSGPRHGRSGTRRKARGAGAPRTALNMLTKTSPVMLHFNGDSAEKNDFEAFVRKLWWGDAPMERIGAALVFDYDNGKAVRFDSICPRSVFKPPTGRRSTWVDPLAKRRQRKADRARLVEMYTQVNPSKLEDGSVAKIMEKHGDRMSKLWVLLKEKYPDANVWDSAAHEEL